MDHPAQVGKYQIDKFLGGGMSHVYRATDTVLGRRVALKILTDEGSVDEESKARFLMEARVASNIVHENIISVYDFGEERGRPFIVMEFLEGESLRAAIRSGHLGDFRRRMWIALQVGRALDHIHSKKIIHRDIKPENIHIDAAGKVKMMDFGIAKSEGQVLTRAGFTLGTPYYMAPEQVLGRHLTAQADVYAFGALLFELITGQKVVQGDSVDKIFEKVLYEPVNLEPLRVMKAPPALISLIERCVAKQPAQRPAGLGVVCAEIEQIVNLAPMQMSQSQILRPHVEESATMTMAVPTAQKLPRFIEKLPADLRTPTGLALMAGAGVALVVTVIYVGLSLAHVI
jgi:serine/threonine protein kinase